MSSAQAFATPLGQVLIDQQACRQLSALPQVRYFDPSHVQEHSLEVHLPFLPSVWEQIPKAEQFLAQLKRKAGWSPAHWAKDFSARRFITHKCSSLELPDPGSIWK